LFFEQGNRGRGGWGGEEKSVSLINAIGITIANTFRAVIIATGTTTFGDIDAGAEELEGNGTTDGLATRSPETRKRRADASVVTTRVTGFLPLTFKITARRGGETSTDGTGRGGDGIALFLSFDDSVSAEMVG